jgi:hypothetical protein
MGMGCWSVSPAEFEALWKEASWDVRLVNDRKRAEREWAKLYENEGN